MLPDQDSDSNREILQYIDDYWERITYFQPIEDGTLIGLPRPYLIPNTLMFRELYYWDSFFMSLGLLGTKRQELVCDITENLLYLMERFGRIPNASRYYHLSRSQPPFLSSMVLLSHTVRLQSQFQSPGRKDEAMAALARAYKTVALEYSKVWRGKEFPDHREVYRGLSRYYDIDIWHNAAESESGWDMTPRFYDRCLDFIPIDLNCLLYKYESDLMHMAEQLELPDDVARWRISAEERKRRITEVMWNDSAGYFFDFDWKHETRSPFRSIAGFFAMWTKVATPEQAASMVELALPFFETQHGIVTTEEWHPADPSAPRRQWCWPNGWANLTWIVVEGLVQYGYTAEAVRISRKWTGLVHSVFRGTGLIYEKYDVVHGCRAVSDRYPDQPGFGWTNAIFLRLVSFLKTGKLY